MKRQSSKPFLILLAVLIVLMSLPKPSTELVRGFLFATMAPVWETAQEVVNEFPEEQEELLRLQAENQLLHNQVEDWKELYLQEHELNIQMSLAMGQAGAEKVALEKLLKPQLEAIPAKVIFRSPSSWNSALWINVGYADNASLEKEVITKNSPVVVGSSLVGILDYVGKHQSRIRLITDSGVAPSVRAVRGQKRNQHLIQAITLLQEQADSSELVELLDVFKKRLDLDRFTLHLAKGEVRGSSQPLWRSQSSMLQGIGFNYDFADAFGPARDLRTGEPEEGDLEAVPIIQEGDLLVTTGMDGVFPPGLDVATVQQIDMLKEGDYFYELEAKPTAGNLNELSLVYILAPLGFNEEDQPLTHWSQ